MSTLQDFEQRQEATMNEVKIHHYDWLAFFTLVDSFDPLMTFFSITKRLIRIGRWLILEGDSLMVVMALRHPTIVQTWKIADRFNDSISIILVSLFWKARKINNSANFCAYHVTYWTAAKVIDGFIYMYCCVQ